MDNLLIYLQTPFSLEKAIFLDSIERISQFLCTYRLILTILPNLFRIKNDEKYYDFLKAVTILSTLSLLRNFYPDRMYHSLKAQSLIRLYVLFNVLELAEKLIGTLVDDIARSINNAREQNKNNNSRINIQDESLTIGKSQIQESAFSSEVESARPSKHMISIMDTIISNESAEKEEIVEKDEKSIILHFFLAIFYILSTMGHTLILYLQYLIIQLSLNSSLSVLYSLIISLQFLDLKGNVTKRGDKKMLFTLIDNDSMKRFYLTIYLAIAFLSQWSESENFYFIECLEPTLIIFGFKILVDWIKHAFFCRYNGINLNNYSKYKNEYKKRNNFVSHNALLMWLVGDSIGFPFPLFCTIFVVIASFLSFLF